MDNTLKQPKFIIGWREWISLPDFHIPAIKAKIDTGARTSAIHAFQIEPFEKAGERYVRFCIHPLQGRDDISIPCEAKLIDQRKVTNSGGTTQKRYVISTTLELAGRQWEIELTLTNRDQMKFRMLLGRSAMRGHLIIDPQQSYQAGKMKAETLYKDSDNS
ncbi:ATP-dependent zinc protease [uncultured Pseudodesulfovibrio sp.]|uniref:ATP-dependent zinc protease family protein n=1 Tax=uncultured Pseudodesulfovibrio sp. TaxID=2035858 RepID=UPI0029C8CF3E|nr:ATP-dependent zinc protease [uncultured Pseudodesulfovibrio sp.]